MLLQRVRRGTLKPCALLQNLECQRSLVTSFEAQGRESQITVASAGPRWLTDIKARIGKCIMFGMSPELVDQAGLILRNLSVNWRDLTAGSEGFLTDAATAGLYRHPVVWGEQDSMGHINNVMYVRYAESGRCNWTRAIGEHFDTPHRVEWKNLLSSKGIGLILKSIKVDYKFPMTWPDRISVFHKLRNEPNESTQSLMLDVLIMSEGKQRPAARCLEDVVVYDYARGQKTALPPFMATQFRRIWVLQERRRKANLHEISQIEHQVRMIETASWDRADAKEDLGSAA